MRTVDLQRKLDVWATAEFGRVTTHERAMRLLEEATEAAQALGVTSFEARAIADRCYRRAPGVWPKELGQVGVCLLLVADALHTSAKTLWQAEAARLFSLPRGHFRGRHAAKVALGIAEGPYR